MPDRDGDTRLNDGKLQIYKEPPGTWVDVERDYEAEHDFQAVDRAAEAAPGEYA